MSITEQAIGLAFNPLEKRDAHGRWTSGGSAVSDLPPGSFRRGRSGETIITVPGYDPMDDLFGGYGYEDSPQIPADPAITKYVQGTVDQIPKMLGGGHEVWNGKAVTQDVIQGQEEAAAALDWEGTMRFKKSVADDLEAGIEGRKLLNPDTLITPLHELIHGNVGKDVTNYHSQGDAYQNRHVADIEEGFTQLGAIQHYGEYVHGLGLDGKPTKLVMPGSGPQVDAAREDLAKSFDKMAAFFDDPMVGIDHSTVVSVRKEAKLIRSGVPLDTDTLRYQALAGGADEFAQENAGFKPILADVRAKFDALDVAAQGHTATQAQYAQVMTDPKRIEDGTSFNSYPGQVKAAYDWVKALAEREQSHGKIGKGQAALDKRITDLANEINRHGPADKVDALASQVLATYGMVPHDLDISTWQMLKYKIKNEWTGKRNGSVRSLEAADALIMRERDRQKDRINITPRTKYGQTIDSIFGGQGKPGEGTGVIMSGHERAAGQKAADVNSVMDPAKPVTGDEILAVIPPNEGESPSAYDYRLQGMGAGQVYLRVSAWRRGNQDLGKPKPKPFTGWKITGQHNIRAQAMSDRINAMFGTHVNALDVVNALPPNPGETPDQYGRRLAALGEGVVLRKINESKQFSVTGQAVDLAAWEHETRDLRGRWTHGASLNVAHGQERHGYQGRFMGYDPLNPPMIPADGRKPLDQPGRPGGAGTPDDPIDPQGDMSRAVDLMISGKHVRLNGPEELPALADEINRRGDAVGAGVGSNPPWDLGTVSVKGTRLFTEQTTGIPRSDMPQLGGAARPGSEAALLAGGANRFIELTPQFRAQLQRDGVDVKNERVNADQLRATQTGLTATTVTGIARAAMQGNHAVNHMLADPIWVSKDNYIIDGHHRWAAGEMIAAMQGNYAGRQIEIRRLNLPIALAVPYALGYAERMGIGTKTIGGKSKLVGAANLTGQVIDLVFNPGQPRDTDGKWTRFPGVGEAATIAQTEREGFSVSPRTGETPGGGYMVAQTGATHTYPETILDDHAALTRAIDHMIMNEPDAFSSKDTYLGGWVHDGKLWLEPSDHFTDRAEAVKAGQDRNQIAIFDLNHYEEIPTGGGGGGKITHHEPARSFTAEGPSGGAGGLRGPPGGRTAEDSRSPGEQGPAGIASQAIELGLAHWLTEKRGYHGEWVGGEGIALKALGIKSRKGWIRVPDSPHDEQLPAMLRPRNTRQLRGMVDMLGAMQAARGGKQASLLGHLKSFMSETAGEGGEVESPVPPEATSFVNTGAGVVNRMYGGGHETYNGQVTEGSNLLGGTRQAGALAYLDWDGSMHLRADVADALAHESGGGPIQAGAAVVELHELTHGVTDRRSRSGDDEMTYRHDRRWADAEEGFTQLGAVFHAREFFEAMGIADKPSGSEGLTMGQLADEGAKRENIMSNPVWDIYPKQTRAAYLWCEQVAQQRGVPVSQIVDEINRLGTASKVSYIDRAGVPWNPS